MRSYKMKLDDHYYYFNTKLSPIMMEKVEHHIQKQLDAQDDRLSAHQKLISTLVLTTYELICEQEKNHQLIKEATHSSTYDYDVLLHDLQQEMNTVMQKAKEKNEVETMIAARHVLNHISKQQIKRKK